MSFFNDKTLNKRQYIEGVTIFKPDDDAKEAYLIEDGEIQIYREENGVRHDLALLGAGEIFGEMALVKNRKHTSYATATEKTSVVIITKEMIHEKLEGTDPLIQALVHMFIKRLYRSNDEKQGKIVEK